MADIELKGSVGELKFNVEVTDKNGNTKKVELTGFIDQEEYNKLVESGIIVQTQES